MIGHLAYAAGAPCPTLILDSRKLPNGVLDHLAAVRRYLIAAGGAHVLKIALVGPSEHPMFDLDYRFVQALPAAPDAFDLRGSCGHSILAATVAAERMTMVPKLTVGDRVRVRVLNNDDNVVCEVDGVERDTTQFTIHFVRPDPVPLDSLLLTGDASTKITVDGEKHNISLVSSGNAYAFVDARALGVADDEALFDAGDELFGTLSGIRAAAADVLGWPRSGAFPKIAAVLPVGSGSVAARAISVPSWHPTLALTGVVCLGSAIRIPDTVPWHVAHELGRPDDRIGIHTAGGRTAVTATTREVAGVASLSWASIARKRVAYQGSFLLKPLAHLHLEEISECLALSAIPVT